MASNAPDFLPKGRCLGTLQPTRAGVSFSATARRQLWGGRSVWAVLEFRREDFLTIQRETAGRISISGVQDKISLRLDRNKLVPTETRGDYILKPVPPSTCSMAISKPRATGATLTTSVPISSNSPSASASGKKERCET